MAGVRTLLIYEDAIALPVTVRDVVESFGEPRGLARTTVLTVMERLRIKGYLTRQKEQGGFQYKPSVPKTELMHNLVEDFVKKTLGGLVSPFVAYLSDSKRLSDEEIADLKRLVEKLGTDEE